MRIAHNLCVDHFRKVKRTPAIKTSDDRDIFEVLHFTEEGADTKMMKRQSHDRVRQMLDLLPEDQREVIILRHYADLSFKEIAALTNCSINTALGRMRYGLINLRKMMTEKDCLVEKFFTSRRRFWKDGSPFGGTKNSGGWVFLRIFNLPFKYGERKEPLTSLCEKDPLKKLLKVPARTEQGLFLRYCFDDGGKISLSFRLSIRC